MEMLGSFAPARPDARLADPRGLMAGIGNALPLSLALWCLVLVLLHLAIGS